MGSPSLLELEASPNGTLVQWCTREGAGIRGPSLCCVACLCVRVCANSSVTKTSLPNRRRRHGNARDADTRCQHMRRWIDGCLAPTRRDRDGTLCTGESAVVVFGRLFARPNFSFRLQESSAATQVPSPFPAEKHGRRGVTSSLRGRRRQL